MTKIKDLPPALQARAAELRSKGIWSSIDIYSITKVIWGYSVRPGDRLAQSEKAGKFRKGRGRPAGSVNKHLVGRDYFIVNVVKTVQADIAKRTGRRNTLKRACYEVGEKLVQLIYAKNGRRFTSTTIWNIVRRHNTRLNKLRRFKP
jgi:hypothetical protein